MHRPFYISNRKIFEFLSYLVLTVKSTAHFYDVGVTNMTCVKTMDMHNLFFSFSSFSLKNSLTEQITLNQGEPFLLHSCNLFSLNRSPVQNGVVLMHFRRKAFES